MIRRLPLLTVNLTLAPSLILLDDQVSGGGATSTVSVRLLGYAGVGLNAYAAVLILEVQPSTSSPSHCALSEGSAAECATEVNYLCCLLVGSSATLLVGFILFKCRCCNTVCMPYDPLLDPTKKG